MTFIAIAIVVAHGKTLVIVWHHLNKEIINRQVDLSSFEGQLLEKNWPDQRLPQALVPSLVALNLGSTMELFRRRR